MRVLCRGKKNRKPARGAVPPLRKGAWSTFGILIQNRPHPDKYGGRSSPVVEGGRRSGRTALEPQKGGASDKKKSETVAGENSESREIHTLPKGANECLSRGAAYLLPLKEPESKKRASCTVVDGANCRAAGGGQEVKHRGTRTACL